jgi:hypothetical protein
MISFSEIIFGLTVLVMAAGILFLPYAAYVVYYDLDIPEDRSTKKIFLSKARHAEWVDAPVEAPDAPLKVPRSERKEVRFGRAVSWMTIRVSGKA